MSVSEEIQTEVKTLLAESYQGEVLGEAYFAAMRDLTEDPSHRDKLDHLVRLERSTKEMLVPYLLRHGIPTDPDAKVVEALASVGPQTWANTLEGVRLVAASYLVKYRRLAELVGAEDAPATDALVAHELALDEFCRRELEGDGDGSLKAITALPHFH